MDKICIKDAQINIKSDAFIIQREKGFLSLSNVNNNFSTIKTIINHSSCNDIQNKEEYIHKFLENKNVLNPASVILTGASISKSAVETSDYVTAIVSSHAFNLLDTKEVVNTNYDDKISISTILIINNDLSYKSLLNVYSCAERAKVAALWDLDVRNSSGDISTGNLNDSLIVACTGKNEEEIDNAELQTLVMKCVRKATKKAILNSGYKKEVLDYIEGIGIKIEDLVDAGMELCVGVEKSEELYEKLHKQILKSLKDLNVVSFIIAGIRLEEDYAKHRVTGINVDDDPAYLYSDEVFGMSVANQIAGTKAIFNFKRYDEEKPGIIGKLGPVLDDVFAGLIAGCMSKIFEE
ncbi:MULTISPECIES: phosphatidylglycerophosphatase A [Methanobacterium]|jgi:alpha-ribazole phosphatase CobZ|uniref:Phosphatidylglycerophosphatase A n=1 Tax=Methanobacterium veterum TaxID=408577 RepID=A0A9E5A2Q9_9EURY|nr:MULTISPECIES: phosphatidylglycerophosphatase A [Methanobacterium]MCZ3366226.1 phosphatidylglycerophosphatase A [Methanobacterium veterum]MCZ3371546.1 phosphatidylglycerophosphatase A [Methanobacterium veterum]